MSRYIAGIELERGHKPPIRNKWVQVLSAMKVTTEREAGDSFVVKNFDVARIVHRCAGNKLMKVTTELLEDGRVRIWRIL
jgi:hypothetical protein